MPILDNPKHEAFAQKVATGMHAKTAYEKTIGGKGNTARVCSSRLLPKVASRIKELQSAAEDKTVLSILQKRRIYHDTALDDDIDVRDRLYATKLDSELAGHITNHTEITGANGQALKIVQAIIINVPGQLAAPRVTLDDADLIELEG